MWKIVFYGVTIAGVFAFASLELKLKREWTEQVPRLPESVVDRGMMDDFSEQLKRERSLEELPSTMRSRLRRIIALKFLCIGMLVAEVILLQR
jgi:hypothetical protein